MGDGLNWGCGSIVAAGWTCVDREEREGVVVHDLHESSLPFDDETFDYVVSHHSAQQSDHHQLVPVFRELRRVLRPQGVLRISVPDAVGAFRAWEVGDDEWFPLGDDISETDARFCCFLTWFGTAKSVFTARYLTDLLFAAGFSEVSDLAGKGLTICDDRSILDLDARYEESLWMEARK